MNLLIGLLLFFSSALPHAEALTARWLGIAGVMLTDGNQTLLFDPTFTKPSIGNWILGSKLLSDPDLVSSKLKKYQIQRADAIFASHTHFDHSVDIAQVAQYTQATVYGGPSLKRVVSKNDFSVRFIDQTDRTPIQVGRFKITPIKRTHPAILHGINWKFLEGDVPEDFDHHFYQFHEGEVWGYFVEHPEGNTLIDQGSHFFEDNANLKGKVDTYFVGVSNKKSLEDLVQNNIERIAPKKAIPMHFDFFFLQQATLERMTLPGLQLDAIGQQLKDRNAGRIQWIIPDPDHEIHL